VHLGRHLAFVGRNPETLNEPRIFVRELCGRDGSLVAAAAPIGSLPRYGVFAIVIRDMRLDLHALAVLLNSDIIARHIRASGNGVLKESFNRIRGDDLRQLPIPLAMLDGIAGAQMALLGQVAARSTAAELRMEGNLLVEKAYGLP
jgi:hypothetical protein